VRLRRTEGGSTLGLERILETEPDGHRAFGVGKHHVATVALAEIVMNSAVRGRGRDTGGAFQLLAALAG
jgi:hypothetical protein